MFFISCSVYIPIVEYPPITAEPDDAMPLCGLRHLSFPFICVIGKSDDSLKLFPSSTPEYWTSLPCVRCRASLGLRRARSPPPNGDPANQSPGSPVQVGRYRRIRDDCTMDHRASPRSRLQSFQRKTRRTRPCHSHASTPRKPNQRSCQLGRCNRDPSLRIRRVSMSNTTVKTRCCLTGEVYCLNSISHMRHGDS